MPESKVVAGLVGLCVGDSLGLPVDHKGREELRRHPVTDMTGYGAYFQPPGTWSEDSSLAFCAAESLCRGFDAADMACRFCRWYYEGYWSPRGVVFHVSRATRSGIERIHGGADPLRAGGDAEADNGNGSLTRILPLAYCLRDAPREERFTVAERISALTHNHVRSKIACCIYIEFAINLLKGLPPPLAYLRMREEILSYYGKPPHREELAHFRRILHEDISLFHESAIRSDSYVVHTLEAGLWSFFHCPSYVETVLTAVNLGEDTETTAAVAGGLAGIYHGLDAIPSVWTEALARKDDILDLGLRLGRCPILS